MQIHENLALAETKTDKVIKKIYLTS